MKYNNNIKGIFTLIITFFVISAFSRTTFDKRQEGYQNADIFKPFTHLEPTPEPVTRYFDLELSRVYLAPDGVMTEVFAINSQYPGPILHVNKGDTISATVKNSLGAPSVIHWHGMFHKGTNWFDGVTGQTQCPIPNGISFTYEFSTAEQSGTYWYHAHTHGQYMEGIRAPLIVHDPEDPYLKEYDYEYVITMSDWYHQRIEDMLKIRMSPNYGGFNPVPDSGLISGVGRYDCSADPDKSDCRPNNPLAVYRVEPGKKYRLRLINTSGYAHFIFSIDNHPLKIIEADGIYSKPQVVNKLPVAIGQRYSVIIEANQKVDNYWMRATIDERCILTNDSTINVNSKINYNVTGILKYEGAEPDYPRTKGYHDEVDACLSLDPNLLKMLRPEQLPGPVTDKILFNITFAEDEKHIGRSFINNSSFVVNDHNPTLLEIAVKGRQVKDFDRNQNIYAYDNKDGTVDLTVINANGGVHPFHIHGHVFYVLGTGPGLVVDEKKLNLVDPYPRDVFTLNATSWTVFRYKASNPGIWSIHCHIEWHVEMGMVAQLVELPSEISKLSVPNSVVNLCDQYSKSRKRSLPSRLSRRNSGYKVEMTKL